MTAPINIKYNLIYDLYNDYSYTDIEISIVKKYISLKNINIKESKILQSYIRQQNKEVNLDDITMFNIKDIERYFELLISNKNRKEHGAFFTPDYIVDYIIKKVQPKENDTNLDPSCGCGAFLIGLVDYYSKTFNKSVKSVIKDNIYGVDIQQRNIDRSRKK